MTLLMMALWQGPKPPGSQPGMAAVRKNDRQTENNGVA
jgi:hypothetical protein